MENLKSSDILTGKKVLKIIDLKQHEIVDNFGFKVNIDYAPREIFLDQIFLDLKNFQNRKKPYSEHSVQNIVDAVLNGSFDFRIFNPIILWRDQDSVKLYILGGHSRYEAFKRLSTEYVNHPNVLKFIDDKGYGFDKIFSMIMDDICFEDAKFIALMSNALSTIESDTERAEIYRNFRQLGKDKKFILEFGKKCEKNNWPRIEAYSFLNPNGMIINTLDSLETNTDDVNIIKRVAKWIGAFRSKYPEISDIHEVELFRRLIEKGGYGNRKGQISTQTKFFEIVSKHLQEIKNKGQFDPCMNLNILKIQSLSNCMKNYYEILNELKHKKQDALTEFHVLRRKRNKRIIQDPNNPYLSRLKEQFESELKITIDNLSKHEQAEQLMFNINDFVDEKNIEAIIRNLREYVNRLEQDAYKLKSKENKYREISKGENKMDLF
ncbi:MAG: hypothetical protein WAZ12_04165 [Candidatus Absconditicoccaceae bacterium]